MGKTCTRKIYYYNLIISQIGVEKLEDKDWMQARLKGVFEQLKEVQDKLASEEDQSEKLKLLQKIEIQTDKGDKLYIIIDSIKEDKVLFRLVLGKKDLFPFVEQDGNLSEMINFVEGDFSLAEVTHCIVFFDTLIMGAEFNFNGARPSAITNYIEKKSNGTQINCTPILKEDVFEKIIDNETYSYFQLCVSNTSTMMQKIRDNLNIISGLTSTISEIDTYEIILRRKKSKKKDGFTAPFNIQNLKSFVEDNREDIKKFHVSQTTYRDAIDLLKDQMVCDKDFVKTDKKTIDSGEMYTAINNFYSARVQVGTLV